MKCSIDILHDWDNTYRWFVKRFPLCHLDCSKVAENCKFKVCGLLDEFDHEW